MVAEQCLCIDGENVMATAEQMQEEHSNNFRRREHVLPRWRHSCKSNQPELRQQGRRGVH